MGMSLANVAALWRSTHAKVNFTKVAAKRFWDHRAVWEFPLICSISVEHLFETNIWGTVSVLLIHDFISPISHRLLYDLCLIVAYEGIAIMTTTEIIPLVFQILLYCVVWFFHRKVGWRVWRQMKLLVSINSSCLP